MCRGMAHTHQRRAATKARTEMGPPFSKLEVKVCEKGSQRPMIYPNDSKKKTSFPKN
jgi:hypothetical protein